MEWIRSQESALGDCTDTPRDNEALEEKLETIQVLLSIVDYGMGSRRKAMKNHITQLKNC